MTSSFNFGYIIYKKAYTAIEMTKKFVRFKSRMKIIGVS